MLYYVQSKKRKFNLIFTITLLFIAIIYLPVSIAQSQQDEFILLYPTEIRFEPNASKWFVDIMIVSNNPFLKSLKISNAKLFSKDILKILKCKNLKSDNSLPVNVYKNIDFSQFKTLQTNLKELNKLPPTSDKNLFIKQQINGLLELMEQNKIKEEGICEFEIDTTFLPIKIQDGEKYPIEIEISNGETTQKAQITIWVASLPIDDNFSPAQLHVHTKFSDGTKTIYDVANIYKNQGYKIVYITDHVDRLRKKIPENVDPENYNEPAKCDYDSSNVPYKWKKYVEKVSQTSSQLGISVLPGAEVTVFDASTLENAKGDLLVYGISNLNGIHQYSAEQHNSLNNYKQYRLYPQRAIDVVNVNSSYSSCAIAHPFGINPSWDDWTVSNYQGFEIFSTWIQSNFTPSSRPLSKWVEELSRLKSSIFSFNVLPSVRAGDDWHAKEDLFFRPNYITWIGTKDWSNKNSVNITLKKGKTVVSKKGSLVYFTINYNSISYSIADIVKNVPTNASLNIKVVLKPIEKGIYYVGVYEDSFNNIIWWTENECNAGNTYIYSTNFNFKGGKHCYYVYVLGRPINSSYYEEFVYTTPIFISN